MTHPWKSDWHHLSAIAHCLQQRIDSGQERSSTALHTPGTGIQSFVWRKHENMSLCTGSSVNTNYRRISSWGGCECWTRNPRISLETPLAAHCWSQRINHSAMTHPSKTDWHQLSGITHWLQQPVDSGQQRFSNGLLVRWVFYNITKNSSVCIYHITIAEIIEIMLGLVIFSVFSMDVGYSVASLRKTTTHICFISSTTAVDDMATQWANTSTDMAWI